MRVVIGWSVNQLEPYGQFFKATASNLEYELGYGTWPGPFGVDDPSLIGGAEPSWYEKGMPPKPAWWDEADIYIESKFTPLHGGPVVTQQIASHDYPISFDPYYGDKSWPPSGDYELQMFVNGVRAANTLYARALAYGDGGGNYTSFIWWASEPEAPAELFWVGHKGTTEIAGGAYA